MATVLLQVCACLLILACCLGRINAMYRPSWRVFLPLAGLAFGALAHGAAPLYGRPVTAGGAIFALAVAVWLVLREFDHDDTDHPRAADRRRQPRS